MKYIDAELLKKGIGKERKYIEGLFTEGDNSFYDGQDDAYNNTLVIIDSLQQEQPDNEDVDMVAQELYEHLYELKRRNNVPTNLYDKQEIIDLWKAGIVYGRSHPKQEQQEVDLETDIHDQIMLLHIAPNYIELDRFARHFYDLGLNARKEFTCEG